MDVKTLITSFLPVWFQVLGFEVDSINSVQFSNHTGKAFMC